MPEGTKCFYLKNTSTWRVNINYYNRLGNYMEGTFMHRAMIHLQTILVSDVSIGKKQVIFS
jgi:hypothetical protein